MKCDVAIIGGGPAGSTVGSLLRKYNPKLDVVILERDKFPRDHVGESQLPAICEVLDEMGVWDKVEAANFPIKIGATYRWGRTLDLWDFEFLAGEDFIERERPGKYTGQRKGLAFQVDRSIYDKILLNHAKTLGCDVREGTKVTKVAREGDRITHLDIEGQGEPVEARYYVDCSGESGLIRRTLEVECDYPTKLRNIAIWDYYQDAEWAVKIGDDGTRIQVMSLGWGWIWFIQITATRTSVGLVVPAEYYKQSGKTTEQIYLDALSEEPRIAGLLKNARREGQLHTTRDWSFIAERLVGENWFLAGDSCGFADPILSAGMTLAHTAGRRVAYAILELDRNQQDARWIKEQYDTWHRRQIGHHIRFADYWYSANGIFSDVKEYCSEIAASVGLKLTAEEAFRWLSTGGFTSEVPGRARALTYSLGGVKFITQLFSGDKVSWEVSKYNRFRVDTAGSTRKRYASMQNGRIDPITCLVRDDRVLPLEGVFLVVYESLQRESDGEKLVNRCLAVLHHRGIQNAQASYLAILEVLEAMILDGWVKPEVVLGRPTLRMETPEEMRTMHPNRDNTVVN